jgi:hypothetical protein
MYAKEYTSVRQRIQHTPQIPTKKTQNTIGTPFAIYTSETKIAKE